jgi:hypothetical protein
MRGILSPARSDCQESASWYWITPGWITRSSCVVATAVDSRKTAMQVIRFHVINPKQMNSEQALATDELIEIVRSYLR